MIIKELKLPFPIYAERQRQHRYRTNCAGQIITGLLTPKNALLPFQFRTIGVPVTLPTVTGFSLFSVCNDSAGGTTSIITDPGLVPLTDEAGNNLTTDSVSAGSPDIDLSSDIGLISVVGFNGGVNFIYNGQVLSQSIPCGFYEAKITLSNGLIFWSEVFHVTEHLLVGMPFIRLRWKNPVDLVDIYYTGGFQNVIYLDTFISHTEPIFTEEVEKDGIDTEVVVFAKITSKLLFSEIVPEYLKTALAAMPVHRQIDLYDPLFSILTDVLRVKVTTQAEGSGCFSFVEAQFEIEDELYRMACE